MEVDYHTFRKELKAELKKVGVDIGKPLVGTRKLYKSGNYFRKVNVQRNSIFGSTNGAIRPAMVA